MEHFLVAVVIGLFIVVFFLVCYIIVGYKKGQKEKKEEKKLENRWIKNHVIKMDVHIFVWFADRMMRSNADFQGAYAIHRITHDDWEVYSADQVLTAVSNTLYGNTQISRDVKAGLPISVRILPVLPGNPYTNLKSLRNALYDACKDED